MREYSLFVRLLAERIYTTRLSTGRLRDAGDFHAWLMEVSEIAERSVSLQEFFDQIDEGLSAVSASNVNGAKRARRRTVSMNAPSSLRRLKR